MNMQHDVILKKCQLVITSVQQHLWVISKVLHTVFFLFKNEFILQNTFTGLQCNLHCALSQQSNVLANLVFLLLIGLITWVTSLDTFSTLLKHFPTEWFLQFLEQVKVWWALVRTVRQVGKHSPFILFQNFRYCTWGWSCALLCKMRTPAANMADLFWQIFGRKTSCRNFL